MKKRAILKSLLILLPILAVGLATTGDSVLVFDAQSGVTEYYSYFDLIPDTGLQMLPPLAAMLRVKQPNTPVSAIKITNPFCLIVSII